MRILARDIRRANPDRDQFTLPKRRYSAQTQMNTGDPARGSPGQPTQINMYNRNSSPTPVPKGRGVIAIH